MSLTFSVLIFQSDRLFSEWRKWGEVAKLDPANVYFQFISTQKQLFFQQILLVFGMSLVLNVLFSILLSHKLTGPIVRLKSYFSSLGTRNEIPKLSFRAGDFFSDLPEAINRGLAKMTEDKNNP